MIFIKPGKSTKRLQIKTLEEGSKELLAAGLLFSGIYDHHLSLSFTVLEVQKFTTKPIRLKG